MNNELKNRISSIKLSLLTLSVIIVNYNVKCFLEQCLCSVINASRQMDVEIIVIDNNSTDGSKDFFKERFANVRFIWSPENAGFSKANNLALKEARGEFVLFLNPDTILPEDCLEKCLAFFRQQDEIGALGLRMIDGSGTYLKESKRAFPSPFTSLFKLSGLSALFPSSKIFARYYLGQLDQHKNHEVDVLSGAFMMIKKKVLDTTGGFDERFFMYGEDVDLSYRIQKAGFKNIYFSESTIIHFKGESTKRGSLNYVRFFYGAMSLFVKKHYSNGFALFFNVIIRAAIWMKASLTGIGYWLQRLFSAGKKESPVVKCLIVAGRDDFDLIKSILQKNNLPLKIVGRINPGDSINDQAAGTLPQLRDLVDKQNVKEIIYNIKELSAKEMITLIQQLPASLSSRFHFAGTCSIVGSRLKESAGDCIV